MDISREVCSHSIIDIYTHVTILAALFLFRKGRQDRSGFRNPLLSHNPGYCISFNTVHAFPIPKLHAL